MAKIRKQGHYCRICGEYKANEKFSGKGHAQHICKTCMSNLKKGDYFVVSPMFNSARNKSHFGKGYIQ